MEHEQRYAIPLQGGRVRDRATVRSLYLSYSHVLSIGTRSLRGASRLHTSRRGDGRFARSQAVPSPEGGPPIPRPRPLFARATDTSVLFSPVSYPRFIHAKRLTHLLQRSAIPPALQGQPVRQYPLRQHNEPAVFVLGEKQGQRVQPSGPVGGMPPNVGVGVGAGGMGVGVGVGGRPDAQAMLAQQSREMEALERRSQRERSASMNPGQVCRVVSTTKHIFLYVLVHSDTLLCFFFFQRQQQAPQRLDEEDSAEELEHISTRTLALTRYRRNHELMNEIFIHAAFGQSPFTSKSQSPLVRAPLGCQLTRCTP